MISIILTLILLKVNIFSKNVAIVINPFQFFFLLLRQSLTLLPRLGVQWCDLTSLQPLTPGFSSSASASGVAETTGTHHHTRLIFVFLVQMEFHYVGQAGLELLTSLSVRLGLPKCWDEVWATSPGPFQCFMTQTFSRNWWIIGQTGSSGLQTEKDTEPCIGSPGLGETIGQG